VDGSSGHHGRGAKTAAYYLSQDDDQNKALFVRTKALPTAGKPTRVFEFHSLMSAQKGTEGTMIDCDAGALGPNQRLSPELLGHPCIVKILELEKKTTSFTWLLVPNVKEPELLREPIENHEKKPQSILSKVRRDGYQLLAERLAATYHFHIHGFYGKGRNASSEYLNSLPPTGFLSVGSTEVPTPRSLFDNGLKISMAMSVHAWDDDEPQGVWDLANLSPHMAPLDEEAEMESPDSEEGHTGGGGAAGVNAVSMSGALTSRPECDECDPIARLIRDSASQSYRCRAHVNKYTLDMTLFYMRLGPRGQESSTTLFDDSGPLANNTEDGDVRFCVYWEGRLLPLASIAMNDAAVNKLWMFKAQTAGSKRPVSLAQVSRVRGIVHVGRPMTTDHSKVRSLR
jgi:hypothetical protein